MVTKSLTSVKEAVKTINDVLSSDSGCRIDAETLEVALRRDLATTAKSLPTNEECHQLVEGDEEGEVPVKLIARFPVTNKIIARMF